MNRIDSFLELVVKQNASDLHLVSGNPPRMRLLGEVQPVRYRSLTPQETWDLILEVMPAQKKDHFERKGNVDFAYHVHDSARFRVNVFRHFDGIGAVFRVIPDKILTLDELRMPPVLKSLARRRRGLVLVTGPTGSGKSTTLSAMIDHINSERKGHILTIEDPIEAVHRNKGCLVSQREVGSHVKSFAQALRSALREDPDIILVGEMRDYETISLAVTAAEVGILVFGTLHTTTATAAVERIINVFPAGEESYIRTTLSTSLCGIISQQLLRRANGKGRIAAAEILINNSAASNIIRSGKADQLMSVIQAGAMQGMQSLDHALRKMLDAKLITGRDAYAKAIDKGQFEQFLD